MANTRQRVNARLGRRPTAGIGTLLKLVFLTMILAGSRGLSQPWYLPTEGVVSVIIQNHSPQNQTLWLQNPTTQNSTGNDDLQIQIPAQSFTVTEIKNSSTLGWLRLSSYQKLNVTVESRTKNQTLLLPVGRSDTLSFSRPAMRAPKTLKIFNLASLAQKVKILLTGKSVELSLPALSSQEIPLFLRPGDSAKIQGEYSIAASLRSPSNLEYAKPIPSAQKFMTLDSQKYFLLSNSDRSMSFVIRTQEDKIIQDAQEQISHPEIQKILIAEVGAGHDQQNRDWLSPEQAAWSWHVSKIFGFATLASQDCDGNPQMLEDHLQNWMQNIGRICFWDYHVIRELSSEELNQH